MGELRYEKGLHDLGNGSYAYLQPDGSWGLSNAGLITSAGRSLLVDTLFDLRLTQEMLDAMRAATPAAATIDVLVNTHANGDHCYGNQLVAGAGPAAGGARIIATRAGAAEMDELPPAMMAGIMKQARLAGPAGEFLLRCFGAFDFEGIVHTPPTETFEGELSLTVGDKEVCLIEVGPAHTRGDLLVHVPRDRVVFTGDILFIEGTPVMWAGPVGRWLDACDRILAMDVDVIVPGHGPITDRAGVRGVRDYLTFVRDEARRRHDAGLSAADAARDIARALGAYAQWRDAERIVVNVHTIYRELDGGAGAPPSPLELFAQMAAIARGA